MNDFSGILPSDFSLRSQGKSAAMAGRSSSTRTSSGSNVNFDMPATSAWSSTPTSGGSLDPSSLFGNNPKSHDSTRSRKSSDDVFNFDWSGAGAGGGEKPASAPVYDKPVYDDYGFDAIPDLKSSSSAKFEDVFSSMSSPNETAAFDDLLGNLGRTAPEAKDSRRQDYGRADDKGSTDFDDLIPGFGGSSPRQRSTVDANQRSKPTATAAKSTSRMMEDPFVGLGSPPVSEVSSSGKSADPLEQFSKLNYSENIRANNSSMGEAFDNLDPLDGLGKKMPVYSSETSSQGKDRSPLWTGQSAGVRENSFGGEHVQRPSNGSPDNQPQRTMPFDDNLEPPEAFFSMPTGSNSHKSPGPTSSSPSHVNLTSLNTNNYTGISPQFEENLESSDDIWLTVSEIPLFTELTRAPPPSRPPPPRPVQISKGERGSIDPRIARKKAHEFSVFPNSAKYSQSSISTSSTTRDSGVSQIDELEDFAMGRTQNSFHEEPGAVSVEELEANSAAAAMDEAMLRAEAKFRHAKEVRERENVKAARTKEAVYNDRDESPVHSAQEKASREKQERLERERKQREREEEREQRRLEKEKERAREIEREREKARQAVERATREARERAATEARLRAERVAVEKANAEARGRAERSAVQRAQAEARERAAAEAKARAERVAAEARERASAEIREKEAREKAEARLRADRAAVERAAAEARERAATEARERATSARVSQQKNENDLESFFSMGARPSSAPRPRANSSESEAAKRTPSGASSNIRKASSSANIVDDLSSIFGAAPSSGDFQDVEGETEDRRRARLERHQRTQERAAKALADKNERDLQTQRDQAERHRIAETLDVEIKRWAAGKEGNLRALLSTLQYVLWPECGWQPVSLTDLITGASVKKVYRKATLCIHPDKVQQKGANLQQKYIAEKVFDLLKESWNKFNSEELF